MATATLSEVAKFFRQDGEPLKQFAEEWKTLTEKDKDDLKRGIGDGTLNY